MGRLPLALTMALAAGACSGAASPTPTTGLTGTVTRAPIAPVCQVSVPCEAPFSAGFTASGTTSTHFRSDGAGQFTVYLQPGSYRIVPDPDAPIISPSSQVKSVTVGSSGLTSVALQFDTGIR